MVCLLKTKRWLELELARRAEGRWRARALKLVGVVCVGLRCLSGHPRAAWTVRSPDG